MFQGKCFSVLSKFSVPQRTYHTRVNPPDFSASISAVSRVTPNLPVSKPRSNLTYSQLKKWEEERKRSDDLLKRHSQWLHVFKQKLGQERYPA